MKKFQRIHNSPIPVIGLTGSIGTGKSTVLKILGKLGAHTISADDLIKEIYKKTEIVEKVAQIFPDAYSKGQINFKKIREIVFNNQPELNRLESILYPHLKETFTAFLNTNEPFVIYEVPLLFEKKMEDGFDQIICIKSDLELIYTRLKTRSQLSKTAIDQILKNQLPTEDKEKRSDFVLVNNSLHTLESDCCELLKKIKSKF